MKGKKDQQTSCNRQSVVEDEEDIQCLISKTLKVIPMIMGYSAVLPILDTIML